jgi:hypothetical protein
MRRKSEQLQNSLNKTKKKAGMIMNYINRYGQGERETVDEFSTFKEARLKVIEYQMSDTSAEYWISSRACKRWTL